MRWSNWRRWSLCLVFGVVAASALPAAAQETSGSAESSSRETEDEASKARPNLENFERTSGAELLAATLPGVRPAVSAEMAAKQRKLERIRQRLEKEPSIEEVQRAALEYYGVDGSKIREFSNQASTKNWAPKLGIQYRRNALDTRVDKFDFLRRPGGEPVGLDELDGSVDEFVVAGTWNLPKLVYNPEKLELASLRKLRERVLKEVTRLYYLRRRLAISFLLEPPKDVSSRVRKEIRIKQTTAMINAMTDGVFEDTTGIFEDSDGS